MHSHGVTSIFKILSEFYFGKLIFGVRSIGVQYHFVTLI